MQASRRKRPRKGSPIFFWELCLFSYGISRYEVKGALPVPRCKALLNKYFNYLSINELRHYVLSLDFVLLLARIVKYSDDPPVTQTKSQHNNHGRSRLQRVIGKT